MGLAAELAISADLARDTSHLAGECVELVDHRVDRVLELEDLALALDSDLLRDVSVGDRSRHFGDVAHLAGQVAGHRVDVVGQVFPNAADALDVSLSAESTFGADLARDASHLVGEGVELVDHRVDGVLELEDLAANVDCDLLRKVAVGDRGGHIRDVAHLAGEVAGHEVDVVRQVLPDAAHAADLGLAAEAAFGADLARNTRHLTGERVELVDHDVDGVLELEDLAPNVDGDLLREVSVGDGGGHLGDVAHLAGEVAGHEVHVVGQVLPHAGDALDVSLSAELAFGADLARNTRHLTGERVELVDHGVDRVLQLEDLALDLDGDLLREVSVGDRGGHLGDVAHLAGQVAGHAVDVVGEVFPNTSDAADLRLASELAFGSDLARHARHLRAEGAKLVHHCVDSAGRLEELALEPPAFDLERHGLRQVAVGDRADDAGHLGVRPHQVLDQIVDRIQRGRPDAARVAQPRALHLAFFADAPAQTPDLAFQALVRLDDVVQRARDLACAAGPGGRHAC